MYTLSKRMRFLIHVCGFLVYYTLRNKVLDVLKFSNSFTELYSSCGQKKIYPVVKKF